uniref:DNA-directed RNA polymerase n=1 Tax=Ananas comosus var. bracteatus TaxID=296719 RepID=A0A6V7PHZ7_ANACO|nr:unnamed protein product [Ananas comosus var. bracteatus]
MEEEQSPNLSDMEMDFPEDNGKGKCSTSVPMSIDSPSSSMENLDMSVASLEKFCKEAARAFFNDWGLISHQINSYNEFIAHGLQDLFDSLGEITVEPGYDPSKKGGSAWRHATISFGKVSLEKPVFWSGKNDYEEECLKLTPRHARLQNMTYSSQMKVEVRVQVYSHEKSDKAKSGKDQSGKDQSVHKRVWADEKKEITIGRLPVMVRSNLCWLNTPGKSDCLFDSGGYFLIKGMEKTFIAQEQRCLTRIWVTDRPVWTVSYISEIKRKRIYIKLLESPKAEGSNGRRVISLYFLYATAPIWLMFFALGASSDKEIFEMIDLEDCSASIVNILLATIKETDEQFEGFRKGDKAREYINEQIKNAKFPPSESFDEYVSKYLFPGVSGHRQKALSLGYMVKCLLLAFSGKRKCDNKDDFRNKRLDLAGELLARELRAHIRHAEKRMVKTMQRDLYGDRDLQLIERYWDASIITNGINRAFSTGAWCHPYKRTERISGIVATLRRTNPLQMMSDLRKTRQQVAYAGKAGDARYPNPSYWGKLCFLSTPDGENCGLVKNLAVTAIVSSRIMEPILDKLVSCGMEKLDESPLSSTTKMDKVFLNGDWIGVCADPSSFVESFRCMRRNKVIHAQVEIKRDKHQKEVRIFSDAGRIMRPLLVVDNLKKIKNLKGGSYSFQYLMDQEIIELIGVEEEEDLQTAWGVRHLFVGDKGEPIPKYSHSELELSFLMGLSCGIIPFANHNFARRVLYQSEKHSQQAIGFSTTNPNIRVDTLSHQLYYPQRPLFKTVIADCLGRTDYSPGRKDDVARPEYFNGQNAIVAVNVHQGYNQEDSLVMNRTSLERGMFRTEHFRSYKAEVENKDFTNRLKPKDKVDFGKTQSKKGRVDSLDDDGLPYISASLQSGDIVIGKEKLCSCNSQTGSISLSWRQVFQYAWSESCSGKGIACGGSARYATPFTTPSVDVITEQLHRAGYSRWGSEKVLNGRTGEMMRSMIFMGPTFYQRLIHMAEDKVKFRNTGPVHPLTRQPVADRKRFGGVKFGEMERDCLLAHGAAANLHERLFMLSDFSQMHICQTCKRAANVILRPVPGGKKIRGPFCGFCRSAENIVKINVPYGAKLLYQELFSTGICLKFETEVC